MTAPAKPWENVARNQDNSFIHSADGGGPSGTTVVPGVLRNMVRNPAAPPLPPRNTRSSALGGMGMGFSRYPYSAGGYGGMYGGYGGGYGGYGFSPYAMRQTEFENRYVQMAEESAAPAFESIDNFVRGFSSVTMMLESTFQAMHMSFRAILGVAENMSRMKAAIFEFLSAFAILKTIYHFYRKVLYFLGLVNGADVTWKEAEAAVSGKSVAKAKPHWPMLAFLAAIIAGPTLVYKYLLPETLPAEEEVEIIGLYDFEADQPGELSFVKGEVMMAKKSTIRKTWVMARKGDTKGYVPHNRIGIVRRSTANQGAPGTRRVSASSRPLPAVGTTSVAPMPPTTTVPHAQPPEVTGAPTNPVPRNLVATKVSVPNRPLPAVDVTYTPAVPQTTTLTQAQPPATITGTVAAVEDVPENRSAHTPLPAVHTTSTTAMPATTPAVQTQPPTTAVPTDDASNSTFMPPVAQDKEMHATSAESCPITESPKSGTFTFGSQLGPITAPFEFKAQLPSCDSQQSLAAPTTSSSQSSAKFF